MANVKSLTNLIDKISKAQDCSNIPKKFKAYNIYLMSVDTLIQMCNNEAFIQNLVKLINYFLDPDSKLYSEKSSAAKKQNKILDYYSFSKPNS